MSTLTVQADEQRTRWQHDTSVGAAWDAVRLAGELRRNGDTDEAVAFAEEARAHWEDFEPLATALGWALYQRDLAALDERSDRTRRAAARDTVTRIRALSGHAPYDTYSPWPTAVLKLASVLHRWPAAQLGVLTQLDPEQLSTQRNGDYASQRARWEVLATKAMQADGQWQALRDTCSTALAGDHLTADERGWLLRRRGSAQEHLGDLAGAAATYEACRRQQRVWYLDADLARVHAAAGRPEQARHAARRALAVRGAELHMRIRTVVLLTSLLESDDTDDGAAERAVAHLQLARWLRQEQGWPPAEDLESVAARHGLGAATRPDLAALRAYWETAEDPDRVQGEIVRILPGDGSGFIARDAAPNLYFSMRRGTPAPAVGTRVSFRVIDSIDRSKGVPSQKAVDVRVVADPDDS